MKASSSPTEVVGEAADGFERLQPDVVLVDIKMLKMDGLEATRRVSANCPTPVVILTAYDVTADLVEEAAEAGASAVLTKSPGARHRTSDCRRNSCFR